MGDMVEIDIDEERTEPVVDCTVCTMWRVPTDHTMVQSDCGAWFVYAETSRRSWKVMPATAALITAVRDGWKPCSPAPPMLEPWIEAARMEPGTVGLSQILDNLVETGLLERADTPSSQVAISGRSWHDLRVRLCVVPPVPMRLRTPVLRLARLSPIAAAVCLLIAAHMWTDASGKMSMQQWMIRTQGHPGWYVPAIILLAMVLLRLVHELGHAITMGAATGRGTPIGGRLFLGMPQAYADASNIVLIPKRSWRISVLLGGVCAEMMLWTGAMLFAHAMVWNVPDLVVAGVLVGGPASIVFNLLLPFLKNDGYFLLQEVTGIRNLGAKAAVAAHQQFLDTGSSAGVSSWWLSWYGLLHMTYCGFMGAMIGGAIGAWINWRSLGATTGLLVVGGFTVRGFRARYSRAAARASV